MISVGGRLNAPRRPTLPQWKIDLVREAIKIIEGEKGRRVTAAMIARRIPSLVNLNWASGYWKNPKNGGLGVVERGRRLAGFCRLV